MKFVFAVALLCIGAVAAQTQAPHHENPARQLAESLEKRAGALLHRVRAVLEELQHSGHGHLAGALEHQAVVVEAFDVDLKAQLADKNFVHHLHHIHTIEEELLHLENMVSEEIAIIENVRHHHQHQGHSAQQLIERGQELVKKARAELEAHKHSQEARAIEHEIHAVEALIKAIQARPAPSADELKRDEAQLARHEQTLNRLVERTHHREPHHHGDNH